MKFSFKKKQKQQDNIRFDSSYFDEDEDDQKTRFRTCTNADEEEVDPLDAFMSENSEKLKSEEMCARNNSPDLPEVVSGYGQEVDEDWDHEKVEGLAPVDYDSDGVPLDTKKGGENGKIVVEALPPIDHSKIKYRPFRKVFLSSGTSTDERGAGLRKHLHITLTSAPGVEIPAPCLDFSDFTGLPTPLLTEISRAGFETPTPIQAQAIPLTLAGHDVIGLAKTGSGKTFSFLWPMLTHITDQPQMQLGDGPIALILSPTRELAEQIYRHAKKFGRIFNIRSCAVFGGEGKWQMAKALKEAPEIVIATPGRLIELISSGATNMQRCTFAVIDECDRMFELGFEYQVKSILQHIRPDRQTLMFSATLKNKVEMFARQALSNPVRIQVGNAEDSNPDIQQVVEILPSQGHKWPWIMCRIRDCVAAGLVLIFVNSKSDVEDIFEKLMQYFKDTQHLTSSGVEVCCLHGGKQQSERSEMIRRFKSGKCQVLVATDVASRGLDIKNIRTVINYDGAKSRESHIHRIGRTGRMGLEGVVPGVAYTLLVNSKSHGVPANSNTSYAYTDATLAGDLVHMIRQQEEQRQIGGGQNCESSVTADLLALAESDPRWQNRQNLSKSHFRKGSKGAGIGHGQQAMTSAQFSISSAKYDKGRPQLTSTNKGAMQAMKKWMGESSTSRSLEESGFDNGPSSRKDMQANPYLDGRGRGRGAHMTQPSWASEMSATPQDCNTNDTKKGDGIGEVPSARKRKSRFSALFRSKDDQYDKGSDVKSSTSPPTTNPVVPPSLLSQDGLKVKQARHFL